jgi:hypothetical protein
VGTISTDVERFVYGQYGGSRRGDNNSTVRGGVLQHVSLLKAVDSIARRVCPHAIRVSLDGDVERGPEAELDECVLGGVLV